MFAQIFHTEHKLKYQNHPKDWHKFAPCHESTAKLETMPYSLAPTECLRAADQALPCHANLKKQSWDVK